MKYSLNEIQTSNKIVDTISQVSTLLLDVKEEREIYHIMCDGIKKILPDIYFTVTKLQVEDMNFRIMESSGFDKYLYAIKRITGKDPFTIDFPFAELKDDQVKAFESRKITHFQNGIYDLPHGVLTKTICKALESLLGIADVCTMSFCVEQKYFGGITMLIPKSVYKSGIFSNEAELAIEIMSNQASAVIQRLRDQSVLKKNEELLKKFAIYLQNNQEEEKELLADQLDNELNQILVALKMDIGMLKNKVLVENKTESDDLFSKLDQAYNIIGNSIRTTLRLSNELRYEVLHLMGFIEALDLYSSEFQAKHKINCRFENEILKLNLEQKQAISLFRIFQEAMSNVVQHASATEVKINLYRKENRLIIEIKDNGIGFDQKLESDPSSTGLIYMKERVSLLNGNLLVKSVIKQGTTVKVEIPYLN